MWKLVKGIPYIAVTKFTCVSKNTVTTWNGLNLKINLSFRSLFIGSFFHVWLVKTSIFSLLLSSLVLHRSRFKGSLGLKGNPYNTAGVSTGLCLLPSWMPSVSIQFCWQLPVCKEGCPRLGVCTLFSDTWWEIWYATIVQDLVVVYVVRMAVFSQLLGRIHNSSWFATSLFADGWAEGLGLQCSCFVINVI